VGSLSIAGSSMHVPSSVVRDIGGSVSVGLNWSWRSRSFRGDWVIAPTKHALELIKESHSTTLLVVHQVIVLLEVDRHGGHAVEVKSHKWQKPSLQYHRE